MQNKINIFLQWPGLSEEALKIREDLPQHDMLLDPRNKWSKQEQLGLFKGIAEAARLAATEPYMNK